MLVQLGGLKQFIVSASYKQCGLKDKYQHGEWDLYKFKPQLL